MPRALTHWRHAVMAAAALLLPGGQALAVESGDRAPVIAAPLEDGTSFDMAALRGQVVYVDFWASWCAPCLKAMPVYDELQRDLAGQGFAVLGVNVDRNRRDALRFLERTGVAFPVVFDPEGQWAERYALPGMPSGYLVDREGVVRYRHVGYRERDLPALLREIEQLLGEETQ